MISIPRWKVILIILCCAWAVLYAAPNFVGAGGRKALEGLPSWLPSRTVNLGLDLQGGSHLMLGVDLEHVIRERSEGLVESARSELRKEKIAYTRIAAIDRGVRLTLKEGENPERVRGIFNGIDRDLEIVATEDGRVLEARMTEPVIKQIQSQTIDQSIEIVRRRVDETGTREPVIQRQGEDRLIVQLPGVESPEHIKNILGRTAQLSFHLVAEEGKSGWRLPFEEEPDRSITVDRKASITGDMLKNAQYGADEFGRPAVHFTLNSIGAKRFCEISSKNIHKLFAIVLDKKVISAPEFQGAICGGSAQITGNFTIQTASDLALLLRAGALPAPLKVMEERTVGPSLGADSVEAGKMASLMGIVFVVTMMCLCYGLFGIFASIALLVNMTMILAIMSVLQATLTLPGIAGIVLTIGIAVDANVLIYERIKEELRAGRSVVSAIDTGYTKALSSITDSNLTTLIAAAILFSLGTGPIKGFAVTMTIGIVTSFFSAIAVTRLMVVQWLRIRRPTTIPV